MNPEHSNMSEYDNDHLCSLRAALLDHPIYTTSLPLAISGASWKITFLRSGISCRC